MMQPENTASDLQRRIDSIRGLLMTYDEARLSEDDPGMIFDDEPRLRNELQSLEAQLRGVG